MTFLVTWLLTMLLITVPFPSAAALLLPHWGLLFVVWWALMRNYRLSMTLLMVASIPMDVAYGTALGLHALIFALLAYLLTLLGPRVRQVNWLRQSVVVFLVLLLAAAASYWGRTLTGQNPEFLLLVLQAFFTALAWTPVRFVFEWLAHLTGEPEVRTS